MPLWPKSIMYCNMSCGYRNDITKREKEYNRMLTTCRYPFSGTMNYFYLGYSCPLIFHRFQVFLSIPSVHHCLLHSILFIIVCSIFHCITRNSTVLYLACTATPSYRVLFAITERYRPNTDYWTV